jgi:hypothetical protein
MSSHNNAHGDKAHQAYLRALRAMGPARRLQVAFELTDLSRELYRHGLQKRYPEKSEREITELFLEGIDSCHNVNF